MTQPEKRECPGQASQGIHKSSTNGSQEERSTRILPEATDVLPEARSVVALDARTEKRRRVRLVRDLRRLADRLERFDRPAADLARHFAGEVAA